MKPRTLYCLVVVGAITIWGASQINSSPTQKIVGSFENQTDVGQVKEQGSATFDSEDEKYTIQGSGANMWSQS